MKKMKDFSLGEESRLHQLLHRDVLIELPSRGAALCNCETDLSWPRDFSGFLV